MQSQRTNFRYRGYRRSAPLVSIGKSAASDFARIGTNQRTNEGSFSNLESSFVSLTESQVSQLQHLRVQLNHYLLHKS